MKTDRRHELQTNVLADWLGNKLETAQQYSKAILASLVAVTVIVGALIYMSRRNEQQQALAWEQYFNATGTGANDQLGNVADKYPDTLAGQWARLSMGDADLAQGMEQLFEDRILALATLDRAMESYRRARDQAGDVEIVERSTIGLARAHEALSQLGDARQEYQQLLDKWPKSIYATEARQRLNDIDQLSTKEFYDWFASQNVKSLGSGGPGIPGQKPSGLPAGEPDAGFPDIMPDMTTGKTPAKKPDEKPATPEKKAEEKPAAAAPPTAEGAKPAAKTAPAAETTKAADAKAAGTPPATEAKPAEPKK